MRLLSSVSPFAVLSFSSRYFPGFKPITPTHDLLTPSRPKFRKSRIFRIFLRMIDTQPYTTTRVYLYCSPLHESAAARMSLFNFEDHE